MAENKHDRRSTLLRRAVGAALTPALALGALGTTGATGAAARPHPTPALASDHWGAPSALTDGTTIQTLIDTRTTTQGTVVGLWSRLAADRSQRDLLVAVRPAGSTKWGAARTLASSTYDTSSPVDARVLAAPDGSLTVAWVDVAAAGARLLTSALPAGAASWSSPVQIAAADRIQDIQLAGTPAGRTVVVWAHGVDPQYEVYAAERTGADGAWSAPARLDATAAGVQDAYPQVAVAADGSVTAVWTEYGSAGAAFKSAEQGAADTVWSAPHDTFDHPVAASHAKLALGPRGDLAMAWLANGALDYARRPAGAAAWGPVETAAPTDSFGDAVPSPLPGPDGDVTLVWSDYQSGTDGYWIRTTTRAAATGTWAPVQTLSTQYAGATPFAADIGADGTVCAGWSQPADSGDADRFVVASRVGGAWSQAKELSTNTTGYARGGISVGGPENRPTALWEDPTGTYTTRLMTATTSTQPAVWRDYNGDGKGDLLALTPGGSLTIRTGTGTGDVTQGPSAPGWPTSSRYVPAGDLTNDGDNDLLVRDASGQLTRYDGAVGKPFAPGGPHLALGAGWNAYDVLTVPGDLTGDGRPDLLARTPSGDLYMYADNGAGAFKDPVKIGFGWQAYNTVIGAGDLNGDGFGDLLARDGSGVLWRYDGNGKGTFNDRVRMGAGWGVYNALAGVGDITGDGKPDLVARDTDGVLWRYPGNGAGSYTDRVRIGGGWQMYQNLY
ncbi:FG-GAP-like repeat-containing protein [Streptomyces sp. NPDC052811]|uniref:FG-GAP-like repeat-containing protein n=1 Tax=Streptomyces sp. NPDC052811 TaxID=3155731 RepID=UPI00341A1749